MQRIIPFLIVCLCMPSVCLALFGAGDLVTDPANTFQNTLTAARTYLSNANEAVMINQQLQQLANEAKQLATLPMSYIDQFQGLISKYYEVMNTGRQVVWTVENGVQQWNQLYDLALAGGGPGNLLQKAAAMAQQIRAASQASVQVQDVYDRLLGQRQTTIDLVKASQGASGSLQAQQATNQLLAVLGDQQASLQQLQATVGRVQVSYIMREVTAEEKTIQDAQDFMQGFRTTTPVSIGSGGGFQLPK